jgi:hypothetical protein
MPDSSRRSFPRNSKNQSDLLDGLVSLDRMSAAGLIAFARLVGYAAVFGFAGVRPGPLVAQIELLPEGFGKEDN